MPNDTALTRVIGLLYSMERDDITALAGDLLERRKAAWVTALQELAREHGCRSRRPTAPRREQLKELQRQAREDARSIARTWNRDVLREIRRLYDANPRGNRRYYARNMERWADARSEWKDPQIALQTEATTRWYAQEEFRRLNGLNERFVFSGPPPTCEVCVRLFAAGVVDKRFVERHATPVHVNCPHEWTAVAPKQLRCKDMWLGE